MKYNPESNCCEHGIQWTTPSLCYVCLREENARLKAERQLLQVEVYQLVHERDAARAEWDRADKLARKRGKLLGEARERVEVCLCVNENVGKELLATDAEVERLNGLILEWEGHSSLYREDALKAEAARIRAQREEE